MTADAKNMMRPVDSKFFSGWEVDHDGRTFIVTTNQGTFKGRPTEVCQIAVPAPPQPVLAKIIERIKPKLIGTDNGVLQTSDMFELVAHPSVKTGVMIVGRGKEDQELFTIAFMGIK